jgi:coenzyme F420-reducing hydrogenase beta subunit
MKILFNGDLAPVLDDNSLCQNDCALCMTVCPFSSGLYDPRSQNELLYKNCRGNQFDKNIGWFRECRVGYRTDPELRRSSASGGLLTWCLEKLVTEKIVSKVAVVRFAQAKQNFFEFFAAETVVDLRQAAGSVYHPVALDEILRQIKAARDESWAIVGVPCLCTAIRMAEPFLKDKVRFLFGLACGMYQNAFYTEMLLDRSGISRENVTGIKYRRKSFAGPANDYRFRGTDNHKDGQEIPYRGLPYFLGKHGFFRQNACNFCMDVFAEAADACFMDAWLPEYVGDSSGTSLVVVRNAKISELLTQGRGSGEITIEEISPGKVVQSQQGHVRRKRELIELRRGGTSGKSGKFSFRDKLSWTFQRYCQWRSKKNWRIVGRRYGQITFWAASADILVWLGVLNVLEWPVKIFFKVKRLFQN